MGHNTPMKKNNNLLWKQLLGCPQGLMDLKKLGLALPFVGTDFKVQEISEWKYEIVALPKTWTKKLEKFYPK